MPKKKPTYSVLSMKVLIFAVMDIINVTRQVEEENFCHVIQIEDCSLQ